MSDVIELIRECAEAGIVFHPHAGRLRPELTQGAITPALRAKVEAHAEQLRQLFADVFTWPADDGEDEATTARDAMSSVLRQAQSGRLPPG